MAFPPSSALVLQSHKAYKYIETLGVIVSACAMAIRLHRLGRLLSNAWM